MYRKDMVTVHSQLLAAIGEETMDNSLCDSYDPESKPPQFGHAMLKYFEFDKGYINLNHGSYGSTPLPVSRFCTKMASQIESNPDKFMRLDCLPMLNNVRDRLSDMVSAESVDEVVMVPNATMGLNTVLRNFFWNDGDVLVGATTTYNSISKVLQYLSDTPPNPAISTFQLAFPTTHTEILSRWRTHIRSLASQPENEPQFDSKPTRKIVAIIDAIISNPGIKMPWKEMVEICKEFGVWTVVDAAHAIGQEVDLNLKVVNPDFWVSNCHKWLFAKRGCAILYVPKRHQHIIQSSLPTSPYYVPPSDPRNPNFVGQFEWTGTIDWAPILSVASALDFRQWLGGEHKINEHCHRLAIAGGQRLAEILGTSVMDNKDWELTANMVNVEIPLSGIKPTLELDAYLKKKMILDWKTYTPPFYHNEKWWVRCSAQIWNEMSDFEYAGKVLNELCREIRETGDKATS